MATSADESGRRNRRLDARVTAEEKALFERAAELSGLSISGFVVSSLLEKARRVIREHEMIQLGARDRETVVAALLDPPAPNEALQRAARQYDETVARRD